MAVYQMDLDGMFHLIREMEIHLGECRRDVANLSALTDSLMDAWKGDDAVVYRVQCRRLLGEDAGKKLCDAIESELEALRYAYRRTQTVQSELLIEASRL